MQLIHTFLLAIIQGITEFLPISSSGHLVLTSKILHWPDQGTAFDLALNIGTLMAAMIYFRKDVIAILKDTTLSIIKQKNTGESYLGWCLFVATIPAAIFGLIMINYIDTIRENSYIVIFTTFFYAILLYLADRFGFKKYQSLNQMNISNAFLIGCAQALAIIPGTSRSGSTITAALMLGYNDQVASRFSFLMAIPITFLAILGKITHDAFTITQLPWGSFITGALISFLIAICCIHLFLKWINKIGMLPFVIYRILLSFVILYSIT